RAEEVRSDGILALERSVVGDERVEGVTFESNANRRRVFEELEGQPSEDSQRSRARVVLEANLAVRSHPVPRFPVDAPFHRRKALPENETAVERCLLERH